MVLLVRREVAVEESGVVLPELPRLDVTGVVDMCLLSVPTRVDPVGGNGAESSEADERVEDGVEDAVVDEGHEKLWLVCAHPLHHVVDDSLVLLLRVPVVQVRSVDL